MQGALAEGVLPLVLRTLYVGRKTGLLHVTRGEERGSVCFTQGSIVYGETNIKECRMGETLVRHGLLNHWELERAREVKNVTGRRLGQVLDALALQVREVLLTVFSWRDGSYRLEEHDPAFFRGYDHPLPLSVGEVILDAVWSITDPEVIRFGLGNLDRVRAGERAAASRGAGRPGGRHADRDRGGVHPSRQALSSRRAPRAGAGRSEGQAGDPLPTGERGPPGVDAET